jgi:hypothetical protein
MKHLLFTQLETDQHATVLPRTSCACLVPNAQNPAAVAVLVARVLRRGEVGHVWHVMYSGPALYDHSQRHDTVDTGSISGCLLNVMHVSSLAFSDQ